MMTTTEIIKEACLWWMTFSGIALLLIACFTLAPWLDKKFPNGNKTLNKILRKALGERLYKILDYFL